MWGWAGRTLIRSTKHYMYDYVAGYEDESAGKGSNTREWNTTCILGSLDSCPAIMPLSQYLKRSSVSLLMNLFHMCKHQIKHWLLDLNATSSRSVILNVATVRFAGIRLQNLLSGESEIKMVQTNRNILRQTRSEWECTECTEALPLWNFIFFSLLCSLFKSKKSVKNELA